MRHRDPTVSTKILFEFDYGSQYGWLSGRYLRQAQPSHPWQLQYNGAISLPGWTAKK
jgi:hypothetical protein